MSYLGHSWGVLPLGRDAVGVFYIHGELDWKQLEEDWLQIHEYAFSQGIIQSTNRINVLFPPRTF